MIFVYHAAIAAIATFVSALAGFGAHSVLSAAYVVESKGMVGSVVGLVASLLSLVLSLLIWTSHGIFTTQQSRFAARCTVTRLMSGLGLRRRSGASLCARRSVTRRPLVRWIT